MLGELNQEAGAPGGAPKLSSYRSGDSSFGPRDYCVTTDYDVAADDPGGAVLAAIRENSIQGAEALCFRVQNLRTGRIWEVDIWPNGEIETQQIDHDPPSASEGSIASKR